MVTRTNPTYAPPSRRHGLKASLADFCGDGTMMPTEHSKSGQNPRRPSGANSTGHPHRDEASEMREAIISGELLPANRIEFDPGPLIITDESRITPDESTFDEGLRTDRAGTKDVQENAHHPFPFNRAKSLMDTDSIVSEDISAVFPSADDEDALEPPLTDLEPLGQGDTSNKPTDSKEIKGDDGSSRKQNNTECRYPPTSERREPESEIPCYGSETLLVREEDFVKKIPVETDREDEDEHHETEDRSPKNKDSEKHTFRGRKKLYGRNRFSLVINAWMFSRKRSPFASKSPSRRGHNRVLTEATTTSRRSQCPAAVTPISIETPGETKSRHVDSDPSTGSEPYKKLPPPKIAPFASPKSDDSQLDTGSAQMYNDLVSATAKSSPTLSLLNVNLEATPVDLNQHPVDKTSVSGGVNMKSDASQVEKGKSQEWQGRLSAAPRSDCKRMAAKGFTVRQSKNNNSVDPSARAEKMHWSLNLRSRNPASPNLGKSQTGSRPTSSMFKVQSGILRSASSADRNRSKGSAKDPVIAFDAVHSRARDPSNRVAKRENPPSSGDPVRVFLPPIEFRKSRSAIMPPRESIMSRSTDLHVDKSTMRTTNVGKGSAVFIVEPNTALNGLKAAISTTIKPFEYSSKAKTPRTGEGAILSAGLATTRIVSEGTSKGKVGMIPNESRRPKAGSAQQTTASNVERTHRLSNPSGNIAAPRRKGPVVSLMWAKELSTALQTSYMSFLKVLKRNNARSNTAQDRGSDPFSSEREVRVTEAVTPASNSAKRGGTSILSPPTADVCCEASSKPPAEERKAEQENVFKIQNSPLAEESKTGNGNCVALPYLCMIPSKCGGGDDTGTSGGTLGGDTTTAEHRKAEQGNCVAHPKLCVFPSNCGGDAGTGTPGGTLGNGSTAEGSKAEQGNCVALPNLCIIPSRCGGGDDTGTPGGSLGGDGFTAEDSKAEQGNFFALPNLCAIPPMCCGDDGTGTLGETLGGYATTAKDRKTEQGNCGALPKICIFQRDTTTVQNSSPSGEDSKSAQGNCAAPPNLCIFPSNSGCGDNDDATALGGTLGGVSSPDSDTITQETSREVGCGCPAEGQKTSKTGSSRPIPGFIRSWFTCQEQEEATEEDSVYRNTGAESVQSSQYTETLSIFPRSEAPSTVRSVAAEKDSIHSCNQTSLSPKNEGLGSSRSGPAPRSLGGRNIDDRTIESDRVEETIGDLAKPFTNGSTGGSESSDAESDDPDVSKKIKDDHHEKNDDVMSIAEETLFIRNIATSVTSVIVNSADTIDELLDQRLVASVDELLDKTLH